MLKKTSSILSSPLTNPPPFLGIEKKISKENNMTCPSKKTPTPGVMKCII